MAVYQAIDLSQLPAPQMVEALSYEAIRSAMLADLYARIPAIQPLLESDPAMKVIEVAAYREMILRAEFNDRALGALLAKARGSNLDHVAALLGTQRLVITPANPTARPPTAAVLETDDDLRARAQLAWEGLSTAGPEGSYIYHAKSASADVLDVSVASASPGVVTVTLLSRTGTGAASSGLLATVLAALSASDVRPLTDEVAVVSAEIVTYAITAALTVYPGPDAELVRQGALAAVQAAAAGQHALGRDVTRAALIAALMQPGVQDVTLTAPAANVVCTAGQAAYCSGATVTVAGTAS